MNVTIIPEFFNEEEDIKYWILCFKIEVPDVGLTFSFTVEEPYLVSKNDWIDLAEGKKSLYLYAGNGEGSIRSCDDRTCIEFVAYPSGSGGDVNSELKVPRSMIEEKLKEAIEEADIQGFMFKE